MLGIHRHIKCSTSLTHLQNRPHCADEQTEAPRQLFPCPSLPPSLLQSSASSQANLKSPSPSPTAISTAFSAPLPSSRLRQPGLRTSSSGGLAVVSHPSWFLPQEPGAMPGKVMGRPPPSPPPERAQALAPDPLGPQVLPLSTPPPTCRHTTSLTGVPALQSAPSLRGRRESP